MPAKVVTPQGNQVHANCGYLTRYDQKDNNGALKRIPFINDLGLKIGDLVMIEVVKNCELKDSRNNIAHIAVAELDPMHKKVKWDASDKKKWKDAWEDPKRAKYNTSGNWKNHPKYK